MPTSSAGTDDLPEPFQSRLISMYRGEPQTGSDGELHRMDANTRIAPAQGAWLYRLCVESKPANTLEIGLACGYSTVFFLAAIDTNGHGHHTALDPFQGTWHGIGAAQARTLGMSDSFTWTEERSSAGLVHLADRGASFGVIFIDGSHRFDDALVDFTLAAPMCPIGGHIVLDDLWMAPIRRAVAYIRKNRSDFEEVATPIGNIAAFRRIAEDERSWNHHVDFWSPWQGLRMRLRAAAFNRHR
jgi:predicted O-methyltransferase YrrM